MARTAFTSSTDRKITIIHNQKETKCIICNFSRKYTHKILQPIHGPISLVTSQKKLCAALLISTLYTYKLPFASMGIVFQDQRFQQTTNNINSDRLPETTFAWANKDIGKEFYELFGPINIFSISVPDILTFV
jgi:hypothetical protein